MGAIESPESSERLPEQNVDIRKLARQLASRGSLRHKMRLAFSRDVGRRAFESRQGGREAALTGEAPVLSGDSKRLLEDADRALTKILQQGEDVPLDRSERAGLEAVILLVGRPAILIQHDTFEKVAEPWTTLDENRSSISSHIRSVGRIQAVINGELRMIATGFLAGPGLIMTNRHVIEDLATPDDPVEWTEWVWKDGISPQIDFKQEYEIDEFRAFALREVVAVHKKHDLALLRVSHESLDPEGISLPPPLTVSTTAPDTRAEHTLYLIGYPAFDNEHVTPDPVMKDIFHDVYEKKRLQPGDFGSRFERRGVFGHDCSTLGGNSGSCVIDLDTGLVAGLHYSGSYMKSNFAVSLWKLAQDELLEGVKFD